jgi:hypothetical protein
MKCPQCKAKISAKHYDPEYEWYECPKCEGCFTPNELVDANTSEIAKGAKKAEKKVVAKGKKRLTEIQEDEELAEKQIEDTLANVVKVEGKTKHKDELPLGDVVNIFADEIQLVYEEFGGRLDDLNARDKALTIWREVATQTNVGAREQEVKMVRCKAHA